MFCGNEANVYVRVILPSVRIISTLPNFTIGEHSDFNPSDPSLTARNSPFTESKFFSEAYSYPSIIVAGMGGEKTDFSCKCDRSHNKI